MRNGCLCVSHSYSEAYLTTSENVMACDVVVHLFFVCAPHTVKHTEYVTWVIRVTESPKCNDYLQLVLCRIIIHTGAAAVIAHTHTHRTSQSVNNFAKRLLWISTRRQVCIDTDTVNNNAWTSIYFFSLAALFDDKKGKFIKRIPMHWLSATLNTERLPCETYV